MPPTELPDAGGILELRRRHLGRGLSLSYRQPLTIVRGRGAYLYDVDGRKYLDCVNNVCHVGHAHPRVVEAAAAQMRELNTNTRYLHPKLSRYVAELAAHGRGGGAPFTHGGEPGNTPGCQENVSTLQSDGT